MYLRTEPNPTAGSSDAADVAELLGSCVKRLWRLLDARLGEHGLSASRTKVLHMLSCAGRSHQSALATTFDIAPRTVTELVDGLERDGLVQRTTDPQDRRARFVDLTAAGRDILAGAMAAREKIVSEVLGSLDQGQLDALAATLRQLNARAIEIAGPDSAAHPGRHPKN
jgi:DNA-binding MarR family transcriptional regulator